MKVQSIRMPINPVGVLVRSAGGAEGLADVAAGVGVGKVFVGEGLGVGQATVGAGGVGVTTGASEEHATNRRPNPTLTMIPFTRSNVAVSRPRGRSRRCQTVRSGIVRVLRSRSREGSHLLGHDQPLDAL